MVSQIFDPENQDDDLPVLVDTLGLNSMFRQAFSHIFGEWQTEQE